MKQILLAWCIGTWALTAIAGQVFSPRIINGSPLEVTDGEFYVALMAPFGWTGAPAGSHWNPFCGGAYIGDGLILTAAHCTDIIGANATFGIVLGNQNATNNMKYEYCNSAKPQSCKTGDSTGLANSSDFTGYFYTHYLAYVGGDVIELKRSNRTVLQHPAYRPYGHDLALIKIETSPGNESLSLPATDVWRSTEGTDASYRVVGHGDTFSDTDDVTFAPSRELRFADISQQEDRRCQTTYGASFESSNMLCAGSPSSHPNIDGKDSCQGDSGGPLYVDDTVVGIVSWGGQCARHYGVYSDVYALRHWLNAARALLDRRYDFPLAVDFGTHTRSIDDTLQWTFINTSASSVTLTDFDYSDLRTGYELLGNGCASQSLNHNDSCSLTLSANLRDFGYHHDVFKFNAGGTIMEVSVLAQVEKRKKRGGAFGPLMLLFFAPLAWFRNLNHRLFGVVMLAVFSLTACSSLPRGAGDPEVLFNPEVTADGFEFSVVSHGCTENDHLFLRVEGSSLTLLRTQKDMCRTAPQLLRFIMPLPQTDNVWQIENPVRYSNRVGHGAVPQ